MDRFLEKFNLPRLNQEEIEIMNKPITNTEIETVIKRLLKKKKKPRNRWLHRWILSNIWRCTNAYPSETLPKNWRGRNTFRLILQGHRHPDTKAIQIHHKKDNYRPISLMNIDTKFFNKILAKRIQQHIKKLIHHYQVSLS